MTFPTPYTVQTEAFQSGGYDAHGNPLEGYAAPVTQPVMGWSVPRSTEPKLAGYDRVVVELELYAPPGFVVGARDRVTVDGTKFEVAGAPEDYNHGPWLFSPGLVVNLVRVNG